MTEIAGTDLTTDAARNWVANHEIHPEARRLVLLLADAYDTQVEAAEHAVRAAVVNVARDVLTTAGGVADRDKYSPQESAAAWDVVDAIRTLWTRHETAVPDPDADDRDGKTIARAAEAEDHTDDCD